MLPAGVKGQRPLWVWAKPNKKSSVRRKGALCMGSIIENKELCVRKARPLKVLQYGEGNFLRAFVDYGLDVANEKGKFDGNIAIVTPTAPNPRNRQNLQKFKDQNY